jgi:hypothetical protein
MGNLLFYPVARPRPKVPKSVPLDRIVQQSRVLIELAQQSLTRNRALLKMLVERRSTTREMLDSSNERLRLSATLLFEEWQTAKCRSVEAKPLRRA